MMAHRKELLCFLLIAVPGLAAPPPADPPPPSVANGAALLSDGSAQRRLVSGGEDLASPVVEEDIYHDTSEDVADHEVPVWPRRAWGSPRRRRISPAPTPAPVLKCDTKFGIDFCGTWCNHADFWPECDQWQTLDGTDPRNTDNVDYTCSCAGCNGCPEVVRGIFNSVTEESLGLTCRSVYSQPYSDSTLYDDIFGSPHSDYELILVGAKSSSSSSEFAVVAVDTISDVKPLTNTGSAHGRDGLYWYNRDSYSFGFSPQATVSLGSCDTYNSNGGDCASRLCWHTAGSGGYRAGCTTGLNSNGAWWKVVKYCSSYTPAPTPAQTPAPTPAPTEATPAPTEATPAPPISNTMTRTVTLTTTTESSTATLTLTETPAPTPAPTEVTPAPPEGRGGCVGSGAAGSCPRRCGDDCAQFMSKWGYCGSSWWYEHEGTDCGGCSPNPDCPHTCYAGNHLSGDQGGSSDDLCTEWVSPWAYCGSGYSYSHRGRDCRLCRPCGGDVCPERCQPGNHHDRGTVCTDHVSKWGYCGTSFWYSYMGTNCHGCRD